VLDWAQDSRLDETKEKAMTDTLTTGALSQRTARRAKPSYLWERIPAFAPAIAILFQAALLVLLNLHPGAIGVVSLDEPGNHT
jgi:hypothetical protein